MTEYEAIRKDLYEKFHDAFEKLYISELKDQIADKDEIITANDHVIAEQQAEIESLRFQLNGIIKMRNEAENEIERLRTALRWYADEHNYLPRASAFGDGVYAPHVITDNGWNARAALAEEKQG